MVTYSALPPPTRHTQTHTHTCVHTQTDANTHMQIANSNFKWNAALGHKLCKNPLIQVLKSQVINGEKPAAKNNN